MEQVRKEGLKNNTRKEMRKKKSLLHTNKIRSRKERNSRTFWQYELAQSPCMSRRVRTNEGGMN